MYMKALRALLGIRATTPTNLPNRGRSETSGELGEDTTEEIL